MASSGFGIPWSHTRTYSNQQKVDFDRGNGWNWNPVNLPYFGPSTLPGTTLTLYASLYNLRYFTYDVGMNRYVSDFGNLATLTHDLGSSELRLTESDGTVYRFHDLSHGTRPGGLISMISPGGTVLAVTQVDGSRIVEIQRSVTVDSEVLTESFLYDYIDSGELSGHFLSCTARKRTGTDPWLNIVRAVYSYYGSGDPSGSVGDLRTATRQTWQPTAGSSSSSSSSSGAPDDEGWVDVATDYYRYYKSGSAHGDAHDLKYVCGPETFVKLVAEYGDPFTASDVEVSLFADNYFEYDENDRVVLERAFGGSTSSALAYSENPRHSGGGGGSSGSSSTPVNPFNVWTHKTVETLPDNSERIVYANYAGLTMLYVVRESLPDNSSSSSSSSSSGDRQWCTFYQYDDQGRIILKASPSAVTGFDEDYDDLLHFLSGSNKYQYLRDNDGLIELTEYYPSPGGSSSSSSTNPASVEPAGYLQSEKISKGQLGTPIPLRSYEYTSHSADGVTVYPSSRQITYPDASNLATTIATSFEYTYHSDTVQVAQQTTILPVVSTLQNGTGTAASRQEYFDTLGYRTWSRDERGFISHFVYSESTGALIQRIDDVDTSIVSGAPAGWTTPSGGGLNLVTDYEHDDQGRTVQELGPVHQIDLGGTATSVRRAQYTVYDDPAHTTYNAGGFAIPATSDFQLINPVSITKLDASGKLLQQIQATAPENEGSLAEIIDNAGGGALAFPQSSYTRWTTYEYTDCCLTAFERVYHTIPISGPGTVGVNYDETTYGYDSLKRRNRVVSPGGTISFQVFDVRSLPVATYVGTNDAGATDTDPTGNHVDPDNNMVVVSSQQYDDGLPGGDGNLTQQTQHVNATDTRVTQFLYDWRNRQTATDGELDFYEQRTYDNLDRVTRVERFDTSSVGNLIARSDTRYDDLNRVYQSIRYGVDLGTGTVGHALTDNTWYDTVGNTLCSLPAGSFLFTKTVYDSLNRPVTQSLGYNPEAEGSQPLGDGAPDSIENDVLLEQSFSIYDAASNVTQTTARQRYHNAPETQLGALGDPSTNPKARVTYAATYPDALGRLQASALYGTNGGTPLTRSAIIPAQSDTILVSSQTYDASGQMDTTTDPAGMVVKMAYDAAGRAVSRITNYAPEAEGSHPLGSSSSSSSSSSSAAPSCPSSDDTNLTVLTSYTPDGQVATLTAVNAATGNQVTTYVYGTTLADSDVAASSLKRAEIYPDSVDGSDQILFSYNRQQQVTTLSDQNGSLHSYDYDLLGRPTQDRVTTLGTGVDGTVRRLATTYDVRGLTETLTSYDNPTVGSGNVLNQCLSVYNDFGQLITEYQSHDGTVNTSTTPKVQYTFADGSDNTIRPTGLVYPNGRTITYDYGDTDGIDDRASRISAILDDDTTTLAGFAILGQGTFVSQTSPEPQLQWTLIDLDGDDDPDTGDIYCGLDRFSRVKDNRWYNYGAEADTDRIQYGYDRASNRIWRRNVVAAALDKEFDEIYTYDGAHRLKNMERGLLNVSRTALTACGFAQCWQLDSTGNWTNFRQADTDCNQWDLIQHRTANPVNEITGITSSVGEQWATPAYDRNGNMTTIPRDPKDRISWANLTVDDWSHLSVDDWSALPVDPAFTTTYDAWNRLVKIADNGSGHTVIEYAYDPAKRRIVQQAFTDGTLSETRQVYFTEPSTWQALEERLGTSPESADAERQFVWGLGYIDGLVLRDRDTDNDGSLEERLYACQDANWNVTGIVDGSGDLQERFAYSAYGAPLFLTPVFIANGNDDNLWNILYCGRLYSLSTSLCSVRHREYLPRIGSWLQRDPIAYGTEASLYAYCQAQPLNRIDTFGLQSITAPPALNKCKPECDYMFPMPQDADEPSFTNCATVACANQLGDVKKYAKCVAECMKGSPKDSVKQWMARYLCCRLNPKDACNPCGCVRDQDKQRTDCPCPTTDSAPRKNKRCFDCCDYHACVSAFSIGNWQEAVKGGFDAVECRAKCQYV